MIAIDRGTSSFRAYRLNRDGYILETRSASQGILLGKGRHFFAVAGSADRRLDRRARDEVWIAPGLACRDDADIPDVIRVEETQILGILDQLGAGRHTVCLPGTHSKWVEVENGKIMHFSTHMTGEAFAVFKAHSILGRMMKDGATNRNAFADGVRRSADAGGMLHHLFGVRSRGLFGELPDTASASYPSGSSATRFMPPVSAGSPCTCCAPPNSRTSMFRHLTHWDWIPVHSIPTRSPMDCSGWRPT